MLARHILLCLWFELDLLRQSRHHPARSGNTDRSHVARLDDVDARDKSRGRRGLCGSSE